MDEIEKESKKSKDKRDNFQTKLDEDHDYDSDMEN